MYVHVYTMYVHVPLMYNVCTCLYIVCTCIYTVHNFNQLSQQIFVAVTEMQMSLSPLMQGTMRMGAVPVRKMVIFWCQARCCRNRGGHQQVYQWLGEPGASWFWQTAFIAKQAACSCCHNWQQDVAYCSIGRRLSSHYGWGTAEKVHAFRAPIVQARSGIQVNEHNIHIHVYTMYMYVQWQVGWRTYMICTSYILCTYMTYTLYIHLNITDISYYVTVTQMDSRRAQKSYCYAARPCLRF